MQDHTVPRCPAPPEEAAALNELVRRAIAIFGGKWKLEILWLLSQRVYRFNELRRAIPGVTQHMLTAQLRELEGDGLVQRTVYAEVPPRVEYRITGEALRLEPVFQAIILWMRSRAGTAAVAGDPVARDAAAQAGAPSASLADATPADALARTSCGGR